MSEPKRILFIEDDPSYRKSFYYRLRREGYYVVMQQDAGSAADWATNKDVRFDMIISDQRMPGQLGSDFMVFLRELEKVDPLRLEPGSEEYNSVRSHLPSLSDQEFQRYLQDLKVHPCIRVILSGYMEDAAVREAMEKGIIHKYISKKLDIDEILEIIKGLFEKHAARR